MGLGTARAAVLASSASTHEPGADNPKGIERERSRLRKRDRDSGEEHIAEDMIGERASGVSSRGSKARSSTAASAGTDRRAQSGADTGRVRVLSDCQPEIERAFAALDNTFDLNRIATHG